MAFLMAFCGQDATADDRFDGRLILDVKRAKLNSNVLHDTIGVTKDATYKWNELPEFSFGYVRNGNVMIPSISGAVANSHPNWEWVLAPGTVREAGNSVHVSLPVALMEKNENCLHNGFIVFEISETKTSKPAHIQIASETCLYMKFDMWGDMDASWTIELQPNREHLIAEYAREQESNLPTKPIADFIDEHPAARIDHISEVDRIKPEDISHYGVIKDGVHYVSGCASRMGNFPHCDQMVMPSYSFAKSIVASFALMRLELLYPGVGQLKINDYVPACSGDAWRDVRFIDALNMMTGNYHSLSADGDEASKVYQKLFLTKTHAEKISFACEHFPHKSPPGQKFSYHTSDTYILGTALNAFWKEKKGSLSDFFQDVIVNDIFTPLGLSASARWTRRTYDDEAQPFSGWGMILNRNDFAKLVWFLGGHNPSLSPESLFSPEHFYAAMQVNDNDRGVDATQSFRSDADGIIKYNLGFWAYNMQKKLGCDSPTWLPYMSGYGGLSAVMLPNNMGYYNVSDGGKHAFENALSDIHNIRSLCGGDIK